MIDVWKIRSAKWAEKEQNLATIYKHRSSARSLTHSANCIEVLWINSLRNFTTNTQTHTRIQCTIQFQAHFIHWHYSLSLYVTRVLCGTVIFQVSSKIQPNKSDGNQRKLHGKEIKANKIITLHTMNFLMNSFSHVRAQCSSRIDLSLNSVLQVLWTDLQVFLCGSFEATEVYEREGFVFWIRRERRWRWIGGGAAISRGESHRMLNEKVQPNKQRARMMSIKQNWKIAEDPLIDRYQLWLMRAACSK